MPSQDSFEFSAESPLRILCPPRFRRFARGALPSRPSDEESALAEASLQEDGSLWEGADKTPFSSIEASFGQDVLGASSPVWPRVFVCPPETLHWLLSLGMLRLSDVGLLVVDESLAKESLKDLNVLAASQAEFNSQLSSLSSLFLLFYGRLPTPCRPRVLVLQTLPPLAFKATRREGRRRAVECLRRQLAVYEALFCSKFLLLDPRTRSWPPCHISLSRYSAESIPYFPFSTVHSLEDRQAKGGAAVEPEVQQSADSAVGGNDFFDLDVGVFLEVSERALREALQNSRAIADCAAQLSTSEFESKIVSAIRRALRSHRWDGRRSEEKSWKNRFPSNGRDQELRSEEDGDGFCSSSPLSHFHPSAKSEEETKDGCADSEGLFKEPSETQHGLRALEREAPAKGAAHSAISSNDARETQVSSLAAAVSLEVLSKPLVQLNLFFMHRLQLQISEAKRRQALQSWRCLSTALLGLQREWGFWCLSSYSAVLADHADDLALQLGASPVFASRAASRRDDSRAGSEGHAFDGDFLNNPLRALCALRNFERAEKDATAKEAFSSEDCLCGVSSASWVFWPFANRHSSDLPNDGFLPAVFERPLSEAESWLAPKRLFLGVLFIFLELLAGLARDPSLRHYTRLCDSRALRCLDYVDSEDEIENSLLPCHASSKRIEQQRLEEEGLLEAKLKTAAREAFRGLLSGKLRCIDRAVSAVVSKGGTSTRDGRPSRRCVILCSSQQARFAVASFFRSRGFAAVAFGKEAKWRARPHRGDALLPSCSDRRPCASGEVFVATSLEAEGLDRLAPVSLVVFSQPPQSASAFVLAESLASSPSCCVTVLLPDSSEEADWADPPWQGVSSLSAQLSRGAAPKTDFFLQGALESLRVQVGGMRKVSTVPPASPPPPPEGAAVSGPEFILPEVALSFGEVETLEDASSGALLTEHEALSVLQRVLSSCFSEAACCDFRRLRGKCGREAFDLAAVKKRSAFSPRLEIPPLKGLRASPIDPLVLEASPQALGEKGREESCNQQWRRLALQALRCLRSLGVVDSHFQTRREREDFKVRLGSGLEYSLSRNSLRHTSSASVFSGWRTLPRCLRTPQSVFDLAWLRPKWVNCITSLSEATERRQGRETCARRCVVVWGFQCSRASAPLHPQSMVHPSESRRSLERGAKLSLPDFGKTNAVAESSRGRGLDSCSSSPDKSGLRQRRPLWILEDFPLRGRLARRRLRGLRWSTQSRS